MRWFSMVLFASIACAQTPADAVLDDWHKAAAAADEARYFSHFAPNGVFLGTDASERWTVSEFRAYAKPHFDRKKAWSFQPHDRHIAFSPIDQWLGLTRLWTHRISVPRGVPACSCDEMERGRSLNTTCRSPFPMRWPARW